MAEWAINGTLYNDLISNSSDPSLSFDLDNDRENVDGGKVLLTLTIHGRPKYSGTSVQCVTYDGNVSNKTHKSEIVTMKVQGT